MEIRPARNDDARTLLAWCDATLAQAMSKTRNQVAWRDHVKGVESRLYYDASLLYIACARGVAIGRFLVAEISYAVAPERRGRGCATEMLHAPLRMFGSLPAEVKLGNLTFIRAFRSAGHQVSVIE